MGKKGEHISKLGHAAERLAKKDGKK